LHSAAGKGKSVGDQPFDWLHTTRRFTDRVDIDQQLAQELSPDERLERYRIGQMVHEGIGTLDGAFREVLLLRDIDGLSGAEVCESLNLSESAMKSRLHRARVMLRESLLPVVGQSGLK
jgi:RNA polymerase sigma-70 factor (ECF subfamily)